MKYYKTIIAIMIILVTFTGCGKGKGIYGTYEFDKVVYLSPLSSATPDYLADLMEGTQYIIEKDSFRIVTGDNTYEVKDPTYTGVMMDEDMVKAFEEATFDQLTLDSYKDKYQYFISSDNNDKVNYFLFRMDHKLWIATYIDNTSDGLITLMNIFQLK